MSNSEPSVSEHIQPPPIPWRVLRVKTGAEFEVANSIANWDDGAFETYTPKAILGTKYPPFVSRAREVALFPSYTFARINPDARLDRLARRGLLYRVFFRTPLSEAQVGFMRVVELEAAMLSARKVKIQPGDFGTIMVGILKGESIQVLQVRKQKLLVKLTRFDARSVPIQIAADDVAVTA